MPPSLAMRGWVRDRYANRWIFDIVCKIADSYFPYTDLKVRANVATELRDNIEALCSGANYPIFLSKLWPVFKTILGGDPVFLSMSYEQVKFTNLPANGYCRLDKDL